jgi:hypothetical protein
MAMGDAKARAAAVATADARKVRSFIWFVSLLETKNALLVDALHIE